MARGAAETPPLGARRRSGHDGEVMDGPQALDLLLFSAATFAAAFVVGLAGFAFGVIAAAVWLHFLAPAQTAALIVAYGLIVQGSAVWRLRRAINLARLMPFLAGGAIGVPIGGEALRWAAPASLRLAIGAILVVVGLYGLARPRPAAGAAGAGRIADGAIGVVNGVIGGATGLAGIAAVIWCGLRGWTPAEQRAVFQPSAVAVLAMTGLWLGGTGMIGADTRWLFVIGLPSLALGIWAGLKAFGHLDDAAFRRIVLVLLLLSGLSLVILGR